MKRRKILVSVFNISLINTNDLAEWIRECIALITYFKVHTNKGANVFALINNYFLIYLCDIKYDKNELSNFIIKENNNVDKRLDVKNGIAKV